MSSYGTAKRLVGPVKASAARRGRSFGPRSRPGGKIRYYRLQWTTSISLANCSTPQRGSGSTFEPPATLGGGLCIVRGEALVLIDQRAPLPDRLLALAPALVELQSETVYMAPEARELIEAVRDDWNPHIE